MALFGADELLHNFVHAFECLLFAAIPPVHASLPRTGAMYQCTRRAIGQRPYPRGCESSTLSIAGQRGGPNSPRTRRSTARAIVSAISSLRNSHGAAFTRPQVGQDLVIGHQPVINRVISRRLPFDAQRLVGQGRERAAPRLIGRQIGSARRNARHLDHRDIPRGLGGRELRVSIVVHLA